ncbi:MAG: 3-phosphoshikimate 1-carboxyvinyltransferase [Ignavibacteriales bacterium]|nr:3-phosphoshikimate 1-carboxyvinyltransferase [Ignavibacteriales bacterium]
MDTIVSTATSLQGEITVPGDKSISHRAVMIGAISDGVTEITGFLGAADPLSTLSCINSLGIDHTIDREKLLIYGKGLYGLQKSATVLDAGNSGTTIRLLSGILAGQKFSTTISGDQYLMKRPMKRIIDPLTKMGARISATENLTAPLTIDGKYPLTAIDYELPIASAQVKSAILLAGLYADGITRVIEKETSRDHTERMLGLHSEHLNGRNIITVTGGKKISAHHFAVPGDPSSAAFFIVAGLIVPNSHIVIHDVGLNSTRTGFLSVLRQMNASIHIENERTIGGEVIGDVVVRSSELISNITLEGNIIPNIIDEIPILSVSAVFSSGTFTVRNAGDLRNKETDRIAALCSNLRTMGLDVNEYEDGFAFESKNKLVAGTFDSFDDHRIAMAFGIAALVLNGESKILNAECVSISFPSFWETILSLQ